MGFSWLGKMPQSGNCYFSVDVIYIKSLSKSISNPYSSECYNLAEEMHSENQIMDLHTDLMWLLKTFENRMVIDSIASKLDGSFKSIGEVIEL